MKSPAERGPVGAWAYEARTDADLSVEEVVARLERTGNGVSAATIRGIEGGSKKPSRRLLRALAKVYGLPAPGDVAEPGTNGATPEVPGLADLIARLDRQEAALTRLAQAMERLVIPLGDPDVLRSVVRAFEEADSPPRPRPLGPDPIVEAPRAIRPRG